MGIVGVDVGQESTHQGRHSRTSVLGGQARKVTERKDKQLNSSRSLYLFKYYHNPVPFGTVPPRNQYLPLSKLTE